MTQRFIGFSIAFILFLCNLQAQTSKVAAQSTACLTDANWQKLPEHPRLWANKARIDALKNQTDEVSQQLLALLKNGAERTLVAEKIVYPTIGFKFGAVRNVQGRILSLALAYRIFGDKRYLERARQELMQLAELPDWCPTHFLDVGEASLAAGIGLDWLYDELTLDEKEKITQAIIKNALLPSLEAKEVANNKSWVNGNFNWNPVCHAGLSVAALAIAEKEPQLARQIVERGIKNLPFAGEAYAPDGAYPEGMSYWSYGTTFYIFEIETLRSVFGTTCDLEKMSGFLKTADYKNQMLAPSGLDFNYSDYHSQDQHEPILLWFGRETGRFDLVESELSYIEQAHKTIITEKNSKKGTGSRHFPLESLWWQPALKSKSSTAAPLHWTAKGGLPMAFIRSSWNDPKASFVAIKGGTPNNSHAHMDVGSFILEADSVRWAVDLGTESYDKMRAAKLDLWNYGQYSDRWTTFRCGPEGHNIMRFDTARQDILGFGTIEKLPNTEGVVGDVVDLTSLYKSKVERANRTIKLNADKSISIEDAWKTGDNSVNYTFQWLTKAKITRTDYGVLLEQNGKTLKLKIENPQSKIVPTIEIEDVSKAKNMQDSDNPNVSRIVIKVKTAAHTEGELQVKAYPNK